MKHKEKIKLARKMMTRVERTTKGQKLFETSAWQKRREGIRQRVERQINKIKERKGIK